MDVIFYETYTIVPQDDDDDGHDVDKNGENLILLDYKCLNDDDIYHPVDRAPSEK